MYQWRIAYVLKNGREFYGMYEGPENDSLLVANKLFNGKEADFISHFGRDKKHMLGVKLGEIAAFTISKW